MIKIVFRITAILLFLTYSSTTKGQVALEHIYNITYGNSLFYSDLGNNNYKYFSIDYANSNFSIYNLDHTPYMLNIPSGVPLQSGIFTIGYISTTLFDCDSSNIEYVITTTNSSTLPFYIYRTDGTLIFQKDSVVAFWCFGCFGGIAAQPIFNSPMGTKLILANQTTEEWYVYSLCGILPQAIDEIEIGEKHFVKITPNPSSGIIYFDVDAPSSIEEYKLTFYNSLFQSFKTVNINGHQKIILDNTNLSTGTYYFSLQSKTKIIQTGKYVISK